MRHTGHSFGERLINASDGCAKVFENYSTQRDGKARENGVSNEREKLFRLRVELEKISSFCLDI
jgi:hypothetical protein